jgi:hypothetical protein
MATMVERAASNMGQQMQDLAAVVRSLQRSAEHQEFESLTLESVLLPRMKELSRAIG